MEAKMTAKIKGKYNELQLARAGLLSRSEEINSNIEAEKKNLTNSAIEGKDFDPSKLRDLEAEAEAVSSAIDGLDQEIAAALIEVKKEKRAKTEAYIEEIESKAGELFLAAAVDGSNMFKKIIKLNKLKSENWQFVRRYPEVESRVLTGEMDLSFIKACLDVLRRMSKLDREIKPLYEECFQLYRTVQ